MYGPYAMQIRKNASEPLGDSWLLLLVADLATSKTVEVDDGTFGWLGWLVDDLWIILEWLLNDFWMTFMTFEWLLDDFWVTLG